DYLPIDLNKPVDVGIVHLEPVVLSATDPASVRMLFGGDVAFGRRYLDPTESTPSNQIPADSPDALIQASNPEPGSRAILKELRLWYQEADFGVFNFETPVTDNPLTPHEQKPFRFFTLPGSVAALEWLGIDYVSMGNNHIYDYLDQGLVDTLANMDNTSIGYSGAGLNSTDAFAAYRTTLVGSAYAFLSMTSVNGNQYPVNFVADETKGGAADLGDDDRVIQAIQREHDAGYIPIVQYHTGKEYIFEPTEFVLNRMQLAADNNVPLLITHHPHVAQGVGLIDNMVAVLGLGNLAFDQDREETMLGLLARVDMNGRHVEQLRMLPVYLEKFAPQLISGRLASNFLRRIGEFSHAYGALVYPYNSQGWVDFGDGSSVRLDHTVDIEITIPESGRTIVDLRTWAELDESLLEVNTTSSLEIQMGRDLFGYGDFEDWDTDEHQLEVARWDITGESRNLCNPAYRGVAALCSLRDSRNRSDSVTANRNRIRVMGDALDQPNKKLSLFGYFRGENAGPITIQTRYYASAGELVFGEEDAMVHPGGTFDWQAFSADLHMPIDVPVEEGQVPGEQNARAVRLFIRHSPPVYGYALASFDEIAVINWENTITPGIEMLVPHAKDFLRIKGSPGIYQLTLTYARHVPAVTL
ncbi:MAG TPA: CapA family protein, partial [Crenotrichaceae bacterium]|nr:CapA family protein [Crenotrichaceae bacterium]